MAHADDAAEAFSTGTVTVHGGSHIVCDFAPRVFEQEREDVFFTGEVVVQRCLGDSGCRGDVFDLGVVEAARSANSRPPPEGTERSGVGTSRIAVPVRRV